MMTRFLDDTPRPSLSRRHFVRVGFGAAAACAANCWRLSASGGDDGSRDVAWLDEVSRLPSAAEEPTRLVPIGGRPDSRHPSDLRTWQVFRGPLRRQWLDFLGRLPARPSEPPKLDILEQERVEGIERLRVRYAVLPGEVTEAYLLCPAGKSASRPGAVVFHSTVPHSIRQPAGVEGVAEKAFGWHLARRGFVTLCPRNYLWPSNQSLQAKGMAERFHRRYPHAKGMARMLWEAQLAVDIVSARSDVDPERIGAIGHSLGAKEVLYLAALDKRVRAAVASEGGIGLGFSNWDAPWYLGQAIHVPGFPLDHHQLLALAAPRPFLLIGGNSADGDRSVPYVRAARDVYRLYGRPVRLGLYNHGRGHTVPPEALKRSIEWLTTYV